MENDQHQDAASMCCLGSLLVLTKPRSRLSVRLAANERAFKLIVSQI